MVTIDSATSFDPVVAATALAPQIIAARESLERERRLPPSLVTAIAEAGLFRLWVPADLGGDELEPERLFQLIEAFSELDGSVGWCLMIGALGGMIGAYLPESGARAIFGSDALAVMGGSFTPRGRAIPVPGGYRVSGRWPFASGCDHCTWLSGVSLVVDGEQPRLGVDGTPDLRLMFFRVGQCAIIDTWDSGGLCGTGSHDIAVTDLFVPEDHNFAFLTGRPRLDHPLYRVSIFQWFPAAVAAVPLGIARTAIETLKALAAAKVPTFGTTLLRDRSVIQAQVAQAEATLQAARGLLYATVRDAWQSACQGAPLTPEQEAMLAAAPAYAAAAARQVTESMYQAGGGTAVYRQSPLDRCLRDVQVAAQHLGVSPVNYERAGRLLLGMDPGPLGS
ncbi:MAG: acyl-CoA dehydrogenase family protein [Dehalococcoidia bacterium]